jgi:hypothetical protein
VLRVKQELISSGLAMADFIHRHPRRIVAALAALLLSTGGAFAVASLGANAAPTDPLRLVTEAVSPDAVAAQLEQLDGFSFTLYRSETTRAADTPEALLKRLGIADPAAASFLRRNETAWKAVFGRGTTGRTVTAEADDRQGLQQLRTHWVEGDDDRQFKRLVVQKQGSDFSARIETAPLVATQRLASGTIRSTLFAATDEAACPTAWRGSWPTCSKAASTFAAACAGRPLFRRLRGARGRRRARQDRPHPERRVRQPGKSQDAVWFQASGSDAGAYYDFDGQSLRKAYLIEPLAFTRVTSGFGMRRHPVFGGLRTPASTSARPPAPRCAPSATARSSSPACSAATATSSTSSTRTTRTPPSTATSRASACARARR